MKFKFSPWPQGASRKAQIGLTIPLSDVRKGMGYQHTEWNNKSLSWMQKMYDMNYAPDVAFCKRHLAVQEHSANATKHVVCPTWDLSISNTKALELRSKLVDQCKQSNDCIDDRKLHDAFVAALDPDLIF
jgi:hypothetical protein